MNRYAKQLTSPGALYHCTYWELEFKSELQWRIQSVNPNSSEIGGRNLDRSIFQLKLINKHFELQAFQHYAA